MTKLTILSFLIGLFHLFAYGQDFWQPTGILPGGQIVSLNIDQEGIFYAGAYNEGILTSSDGGLEWNLSLEGDFHEDFAEHPSGDVYLSGRHGIVRSTNHGGTWEVLSVYPGISFHGIAFNSLGHFFVGEESDWNIGHMLRSTDDGLTWGRIYLDGSMDYPLDFVVKANDDMFVAAGPVYKSTDAGETWLSSSAGLEDVSVANLTIDSEGRLYAGTYFDGVFTSTDDGDSWVQTTLDSGMVADIVIIENDRIFAGSSGVYTSTDHGSTWREINEGLGNRAVRSLAYAGDGIFIYGSWGSAFYRSTDYGEHWTKNTAGLALFFSPWVGSSPEGMVCVAAELGGGVFASSDNGNSWVQSGLEGSYISSRSFSVGADGHLFLALGGSGVYRTTDNGGTWAFAGLEGLTGVDYLPIEVNTEGDVFAGWNPHGYGIHRSTDDGNTWTLLGEQDGISEVSCIAIGLDEDIYVGTFDTEIYRSTDNGQTWARKDSGLTGISSIWSLGVSVNGDVFAAGWGTIYRSTNRGETWVQSDSGFPQAFLHDFLFTPSGHIYAASSFSGIHRSTDNGVSWHEINSGLTDVYVYSLTLDNTGHAYAGTSSGVFRSTEAVASATGGQEIPVSFYLHHNYPNPFNPSTTIRFALPRSSEVSLTVFNLLGEEVATLAWGEMEAGTHTVQWDATGQPSGVYFYRLQAGGFTETRKLVLLR